MENKFFNLKLDLLAEKPLQSKISATSKLKALSFVSGLLALMIVLYVSNLHFGHLYAKVTPTGKKIFGYVCLVLSLAFTFLAYWKSEKSSLQREYLSLGAIILFWIFDIYILKLSADYNLAFILAFAFAGIHMYLLKTLISFVLFCLALFLYYFASPIETNYEVFIFLTAFIAAKPYILHHLQPNVNSLRAIVMGWVIVLLMVPCFLSMFTYHTVLLKLLLAGSLYLIGKVYYNHGNSWVEKPFQVMGIFMMTMIIVLAACSTPSINSFALGTKLYPVIKDLCFKDIFDMVMDGSTLGQLKLGTFLLGVLGTFGTSITPHQTSISYFQEYNTVSSLGFLSKVNWNDKMYYLNTLFIIAFVYGNNVLKNKLRYYQVKISYLIYLTPLFFLVVILFNNNWISLPSFSRFLLGLFAIIWSIHFISNGVNRAKLSYQLFGITIFSIFVLSKIYDFDVSVLWKTIALLGLASILFFFNYLIKTKIKEDNIKKDFENNTLNN